MCGCVWIEKEREREKQRKTERKKYYFFIEA